MDDTTLTTNLHVLLQERLPEAVFGIYHEPATMTVDLSVYWKRTRIRLNSSMYRASGTRPELLVRYADLVVRQLEHEVATR